MSIPELVVADSKRISTVTPHHYHIPDAKEFKLNRPNFEGIPIDQHHFFKNWVGKATQPVEISQEVADLLGLSSTLVPRFRLIPAVKRYKP